MNWLRTTFSNIRSWKRRWHGLGLGCLLWVAWKVFGFWSTLLLFILAAVGYIIGRVLEERQSWRQVVEKLLSEHFGDS